jgi:hypothetical protein
MRFLGTLGSQDQPMPPSLLNHYARICCTAHRLILDFLRALDPSRYTRVKGEELLENPAEQLGRIARWLHLDPSPAAVDAMLHPERSPFAFSGSPGIGGDNDVGFLESAKGSAARRQTVEELRSSVGGALDTAPLLRDSSRVQPCGALQLYRGSKTVLPRDYKNRFGATCKSWR